jgi:hypothetical protein
MIDRMPVVRSRSWVVHTRLAGALMLLVTTSLGHAHADANGSVAAAVGITAADGSVRTQAGVRLSINAPASGADHVVAMSRPVQARMAALRECFGSAMARSSTTEGRAEFEIEATARGATKVRVTLDETRDPELLSCMKSSLARTSLRGVPAGSRALVGLYLSNPLAAMRKRLTDAAPKSEVHMLAGGQAESGGGTQAGEIRFEVRGSAYAASTIGSFSHDVSAHLAGLLDCRRKALRRERETGGSVEFELSVRAGAIGQSKPRSTMKQASQCVAAWLAKLDASQLQDADLRLAISFAR